MAVKPRYEVNAKGKVKAKNAEAKKGQRDRIAKERERLTQVYTQAGQVVSKARIAREARINMGSGGG